MDEPKGDERETTEVPPLPRPTVSARMRNQLARWLARLSDKLRVR